MSVRLLVRLMLVAAAAGAVSCGDSPLNPSPPPTPTGPLVRLVYATPPERPFSPEYSSAVASAFSNIQAWYRGQMDGRTFSLYRATPEPCTLPRPMDDYREDTWTRVMTDVQQCAPVAYDDTQFRWAIYADVVHACNAPGRIGAALRGVTIMGHGDLEGLSGRQAVNDCGNVDAAPLGRWIGGAAHELGHAFGLRHPPGCSDGLSTCDRYSLMWLGYRSYPSTFLRDEDKQTLLASPFIQ